MTGRSTLNEIERMIGDFRYARTYEYAVVIALDASSAFDSINWSVIMNNVIKSNTNNTIIKMIIQSILIDRSIILEDKIFQRQQRLPTRWSM